MISKDIIKLISKGDRQAFDKLFVTYYRPLCQFAFSFLNDWDESEEIVQNVFLKLWENKDTLTIHTSVKSYLYSAAHNACINRVKHYKVKSKYLDYVLQQENTLQHTDNLIAKELQLKIENSIAELPDQRRIIFKMSRFEGMKYTEIADKLNISVKTVEAQMTRALKALRIALKEYLPVLVFFLVQ